MTPNDFAYFMRFGIGRWSTKHMERRKDEYFAVFSVRFFSTGQDCRGEWRQGQLLLLPLNMSEINFHTSFP